MGMALIIRKFYKNQLTVIKAKVSQALGQNMFVIVEILLYRILTTYMDWTKAWPEVTLKSWDSVLGGRAGRRI